MQICFLLADLPIARKNSLARFLEKRKDRYVRLKKKKYEIDLLIIGRLKIDLEFQDHRGGAVPSKQGGGEGGAVAGIGVSTAAPNSEELVFQIHRIVDFA